MASSTGTKVEVFPSADVTSRPRIKSSAANTAMWMAKLMAYQWMFCFIHAQVSATRPVSSSSVSFPSPKGRGRRKPSSDGGSAIGGSSHSSSGG